MAGAVHKDKNEISSLFKLMMVSYIGDSYSILILVQCVLSWKELPFIHCFLFTSFSSTQLFILHFLYWHLSSFYIQITKNWLISEEDKFKIRQNGQLVKKGRTVYINMIKKTIVNHECCENLLIHVLLHDNMA